MNNVTPDVDVGNLNLLLPEEKEELRELYSKWETARNAKAYVESDRLRLRLMWWDCNIVNDGLWHPTLSIV